MDYGDPLKWAVWLAAGRLFGQDASETLEKARDKVLAAASHLPRYICVETIERSYFSRDHPPSHESCEQIGIDRKKAKYKLRLDATDRLRVMVGFGQDREVYSWTGRAPLAHPIDVILEPGPMGTGAFAAHLLDIFSNPAVRFRLLQEKQDTLEYGFRVAIDASRFLVAAGSEWVPAGYDGSFDIDRTSFDVWRFTIETGELPPQTSLCEASATHEFPNRQPDDSVWFVPSVSRSREILRDAAETDRVVRFSDCHESTANLTPRSLEGDPLPPGLPVSLVFTAPIDSDTAAAGDTISATVTEDVVSGSKVLAPAGAIVTGRIVRMEHQLAVMENGHRLPQAFVISVAFDTLEVKGVVSPFYATLVRPAPTQMQVGNPRLKDWPHGTFVFPSNDARYVVRTPFESRWRTVPPPVSR